jgi:predicted O-methyltransferase YrrM
MSGQSRSKRLSLFAGVLAIMGGVAVAQEGRKADDLSTRERRVIETIGAFERERRGFDMSVPRADGELLRRLVEENKVRVAVEIGTFRGYSGLWLGLGLLRTNGRLTTFEIDPRNAETARQRFEHAGVADVVTIVVGNAHAKVTGLEGPIDLLFLDADPGGYINYLDKLLPKLRVGGLIVTHNVASPRPDPTFIRTITTNPSLDTRFVNMEDRGVAITRKLRRSRRNR